MSQLLFGFQSYISMPETFDCPSALNLHRDDLS